MTLLDALSNDFSLKVISKETDDSRNYLKSIYKNQDVEFLETTPEQPCNSLIHRAKRHIRRKLKIQSKYNKEACQLLSSTSYDLLWIIHEKTLNEFKAELKGKKYVVSLYELNDHDRSFLENIRESLSNAQEVIVPEYNRACILRVWEKLLKTPTVLPNKPLHHPKIKYIKNQYTNLLEGKKIILYQGYIQRSRNIDAVCEACREIPNYIIVIMGGGDSTYIEDLKTKYSNVIHIPFVTPPEHLKITSYAHIGIVKYDMVSLNAIFCAPNKTWEYSGFGIPVLGHNIPGLQDSIGKYSAGLCCDMDNKDEIKIAIAKIDAEYLKYSQNATNFYNSIDIKKLTFEIAYRNI